MWVVLSVGNVNADIRHGSLLKVDASTRVKKKKKMGVGNNSELSKHTCALTLL